MVNAWLLAGALEDAGAAWRLEWTERLEFAPVMKLAENVEEAMRLMQEIDRIGERLPGLDCGSCGAPTCRALAEDVVRGHAAVDDCVVLLRRRMEAVLQAVMGQPGKEDEP